MKWIDNITLQVRLESDIKDHLEMLQKLKESYDSENDAQSAYLSTCATNDMYIYEKILNKIEDVSKAIEKVLKED